LPSSYLINVLLDDSFACGGFMSRSTRLKHVVVVGGSGGIGFEVVRRLEKRGITPHIFDIKQPEERGFCEFYSTDVTDVNSLKNSFEKLPVCIDGMVHLVGGACASEFAGFKNTPFEDIATSVEVNLISALRCAHVCLDYLRDERDSSQPAFLTLISSIFALRSFGLPAYSSAKAGILGFVRSSCAELGEDGVRINAVLPGTVRTPRTSLQPKSFAEAEKGTLLGKLPEAGEIAEIVVSLSVDWECVTGQLVVADCGQSARSSHSIYSQKAPPSSRLDSKTHSSYEERLMFDRQRAVG
jgi:NAD(P)-dependent dehydrogenase (short-subunit alcohol dehydrogenase family)